MGEVSDISWTDATHNEWIGCTKVSPGCANCYAETLMDTRYGRVKWGKGQPRSLTSEANRRKPLAWDKAAAKAGKRTRVFSASLSDWLDDEVPAIWLGDLLTTVERTPNLDWLMLTKRPQNWRSRLLAAQRAIVDESERMMPRVNGFIERWLAGDPPPNVWVGTTTEDQKRADERVPRLCDIPARVRFLSCEPLLGPLDLSRWLPDDPDEHPGDDTGHHGGVDWIIVGGESGHGARPMHPAWARALREQAKYGGMAFHFKQWGEHIPVCPVYPEPGVDVDAEGCDLDPPSMLDPFPDRAVACVDPAGGTHDIDRDGQPPSGCFYMARVGKKKAGRELDGRTWDELPAVQR